MTIASTSSIVIATNSSSINNKEAMDVSASKDAPSASETANSNNTRHLKVSSSPATSADAPQPSNKCSATIPSFCQSQHTPTTPTATMRDETTDEEYDGQGPSNSPQDNAPSARVTNENAENTPTTRHQSFSGNHSLHRTTAISATVAEPPTGAVATIIHKAGQNESPDDNTHQIDSENHSPSNAKVLPPLEATDAKEATKTISDTNQKEQINHSGSVGDDGAEDEKVAWQLHDGGETDESQTATTVTTTEIQSKKKKQYNKPPNIQAGSDKWGVDFNIQKQLAIDLETRYPPARGGIHTLLSKQGQSLSKFLDKKNLEHCGIYGLRGSKQRVQICQLIQYWKGFDPEKYQQTILRDFNLDKKNPATVAPSSTNDKTISKAPDQKDKWSNETPEDYQRRMHKNEVSRLWHRIRNQRATDKEKRRYTEITGKAQPTIRSYKSCTERVRQIVRQKELETQSQKVNNSHEQHNTGSQRKPVQSTQQPPTQQQQQQQLNHQQRMHSIRQVERVQQIVRQKELKTQSQKVNNSHEQHNTGNQRKPAQSTQQPPTQQQQQQQLNHQQRMQSIQQVATTTQLSQSANLCGPYSQITRAPNAITVASPPIPWLFGPYRPSPTTQPLFPPPMPFYANRPGGYIFAPPAGIMPQEFVPILQPYSALPNPRQWENQLAGPANATPQDAAARRERINNDMIAANIKQPGTAIHPVLCESNHRASRPSPPNQDNPATVAATNNLNGGKQETPRKRKAFEFDGDRNVVSPQEISSTAIEAAEVEALPASQPDHAAGGKRHASKPHSKPDASRHKKEAGAKAQQFTDTLDCNGPCDDIEKPNEDNNDTYQEREQQWMIPEEFVFTC